MSIFRKKFHTRIFSFLSAISSFFYSSWSIDKFLFQLIQNNKFFVNSIGDENSPNKIAIIKLNGPILNEPSSNFDVNLFSTIEIIYTSYVKESFD